MSLYTFQKALLRLYTDKPSLESFYKDPGPFILDHSLTKREQLAIMSIPEAELKEFQHQLRTKRRRIAEKILRKPNMVVAVPFHEIGSPLLMWGSTPEIRQAPLSPGMFLLLHAVAKQQSLFTLSALLRTYSKDGERYSVWDLFSLARLMYAHKLTEYTIKAL